ncbi:MAG TPA: lysylphosphatidylglycerol synthase transmembrane domain-containing protein [Mycobacteriales bacterium]|nr:lysylphosphatidylglycerol synthase transmembrane domain-containing protein [Mycobacteriales bacterium]
MTRPPRVFARGLPAGSPRRWRGPQPGAAPGNPPARPGGRPSRRRLLLRLAGLLVAVPACYAIAPQIVEVFAAWPRIRGFHPAWFALMLALEVGSFACVWHLLRIIAPGLSWSVAAYSHITANAVSRLFPGGGAVGNACHFRMLMVAGMEATRAGSTVTASALLTGSLVFALPVFAVPAIVLGQIPPRLSVAVVYGAAVFAVLAGLCVLLARADWSVRAVGRLAGWVLHRAGRSAPGLPALLLRRRNEVCTALGRRWRAASLAAAGRSTLDFSALYVALAGTGQHPSPALVLVAYVAATVLTMIPITPGGVGFVEAGLVGTLVLAGVPAGPAALATLVYRLVSFWLPVPMGLPAWLAFRRRHGSLPPEPAIAAHGSDRP